MQSASLLLRIDLILSGMSKKPKGGEAQPQAQQAPAGDEVSPWIFWLTKLKISDNFFSFYFIFDSFRMVKSRGTVFVCFFLSFGSSSKLFYCIIWLETLLKNCQN